MSLFIFIDYIYIILISIFLMLFVLFIYFLPFTLYFKKCKPRKSKYKNSPKRFLITKSFLKIKLLNIFKFLKFCKKFKCLNFYSNLYYKSKIINNFFRLNKLYLKSKITKIIPYCKSIVIFCLCLNIITINLLSLVYYSISINYSYILNLLILFIFFKALIYFLKKNKLN